MIHRNTAVPTTVSKRFRTKTNRVGPASGIRVVVTQGDTPDASLAEVLGTARITGIPPNDPPGQPVDIIGAANHDFHRCLLNGDLGDLGGIQQARDVLDHP